MSLLTFEWRLYWEYCFSSCSQEANANILKKLQYILSYLKLIYPFHLYLSENSLCFMSSFWMHCSSSETKALLIWSHDLPRSREIPSYIYIRYIVSMPVLNFDRDHGKWNLNKMKIFLNNSKYDLKNIIPFLPRYVLSALKTYQSIFQWYNWKIQK